MCFMEAMESPGTVGLVTAVGQFEDWWVRQANGQCGTVSWLGSGWNWHCGRLAQSLFKRMT